MDRPRLLVFGASGAIGGEIVRRAAAAWTVVGATRRAGTAGMSPPGPPIDWLTWDPLADAAGDALTGQTPFDAVCWAQGANAGDSIRTFDPARHLDLYRANCLSVMAGAAALVRRGLLRAGGARLVVISSLWQERARADKLSYTVTKAATGGLVRSLSVDLGANGHLVNAVLPGVLDTPMTAANLSPAQIAVVRGKTTVGRLPDLGGLAETVLFLCSAANTSISGQSVAVDLGMNVASLV